MGRVKQRREMVKAGKEVGRQRYGWMGGHKGGKKARG